MKKFFAFLGFALIFGVAIFYSKHEPASGFEDMASRSPAGIQGQQAIIDQMNHEILAMTNRDDVVMTANKIIQLAQQDTQHEMPGVQLYAAVASIVPDLEGIFFRCRSFVESADMIHMSWLYGLRDFSYNDYLYGPHIKAMFDFVTYPSNKAGPQFAKVSDLQDYLLGTIAPKLQKFLAMGEQLENLPAQNFEFMFDRTILVGSRDGMQFIDPQEVHKRIIKPYFYTVTFLTHMALGSIEYLGAMDLDDLAKVSNGVIRQTTINTVWNNVGLRPMGRPALGVTPMMTYEVIKNQSSTFLSWRKPGSFKDPKMTVAGLLDGAYKDGMWAAYFEKAAYVCGIKYPLFGAGQASSLKQNCQSFDNEGEMENRLVPNGSKFFFNPNRMVLHFKKKYHMLRDRYRAYEESQRGYSTILSDVTGQSVNVNLKAFFNEKASQRDFLPTAYFFANESRSAVSKLGTYAWNYDHGKPQNFRDFTFNGFFDPAQVHDSKSLYQAMATVMYTGAIEPFAVFVRAPSSAHFMIPLSEIFTQ